MERRDEFDAINSTLSEVQRAARRPCCGTVLTGPAGVGKTTLARQVTAEHNGVRWIAGTESARSIPLGAFANVVAPAAARDTIGVLSSARESLLSRGSLVLGVDDAHLLDPLSATLLHQLAIDGDARIVVTVRSGETLPDAVMSLWKDDYLRRIELFPFTKEQSVQLVERALGGHLEGLSAELMWEASGGNALFLRHLVDGAVESGHLREADGVWQLRGTTTVTAEFATLLDSRIEALPDPVRRVLDLVSLCEPTELDLLCGLAGEDAVDDAEIRELIRISRGGNRLAARFTHPLFGEVVRSRLGRARARRLRGKLVGAMQERGLDTGNDKMRLAELAVESDQDIGVVPLIEAARVAIGLSDVAAGERFSRAGFETAPTIDTADLLARSLLWQGKPYEAERVMSSVATDDLDEIGVLRWGMTQVSNYSFAMGDNARASQMLQMLRERITIPDLVLIVDGMDAVLAMHANRLEPAVELARAVLATTGASPTARFWAGFAAQRALALMGRSTDVAAIAADLRVPSSVDGLLRYSAAFGEEQALVNAGDFEGADRCAAKYAEFSSPGQYLAWGMTQTLSGFAAVARGRFPEAIIRLQEATAALASDAFSAWSFPARTALVQANALLGRVEPAREVACATRAALKPHVAVFEPSLRVAEGWLAVAEGVTVEGRRVLGEAAVSARESGQYAVETGALHSLARLGDGSVSGRLGELVDRVDGDLAPVYARHAAAVAAKDAGVLEKCGMEFEQIGAMPSAADAFAQASAAYDLRGNGSNSSRTARAAHRLATDCGGLVTPALTSIDDPLPLTPREREIANLVAAGLSNREIGERLTLSTRTVEGHIYRACIKLDVTDRGDLGGRARGEP
ncbi:HTH-type transcriptional regulator MalT [Gordonia insulae]|uniref:HTH-type transcriptional regulator MalT n=1 Tax=Gordonia insulae TaxID=2420509 RepID=A0A3G8JQ42_9ACTN|nr:HTH-type transcriptional regulator MalT [Gordonia insulae]